MTLRLVAFNFLERELNNINFHFCYNVCSWQALHNIGSCLTNPLILENLQVLDGLEALDEGRDELGVAGVGEELYRQLPVRYHIQVSCQQAISAFT